MTELPPRALDIRCPFSRADARRAGIPMTEVLGPRFKKVLYDRYVSADVVVTLLLMAATALSVSPRGSAITHQTAARLWGGIVPDDPDVHVSHPGTSRSRRKGLRAHRLNPASELRTHRGVLLSSPAQCFLDLAGVLGLVDLVVLGDSLVRAEAVTIAELIRAADSWRGNGAVLARRAARLVREGVDSPMETMLRLLLVLAGVIEPEVNPEVVSQDGSRAYRLDLFYVRWRIAVEYEGRHHAGSRAQWGHDLIRREDLDTLDIRLVLVRAEGIYDDPRGTLDRVVRALRDRGADVRITSDEWRRHFPGRRSTRTAA